MLFNCYYLFARIWHILRQIYIHLIFTFDGLKLFLTGNFSYSECFYTNHVIRYINNMAPNWLSNLLGLINVKQTWKFRLFQYFVPDFGMIDSWSWGRPGKSVQCSSDPEFAFFTSSSIIMVVNWIAERETNNLQILHC
jgi:hypothetical protein